jgi:hypothetical protein
LANVFVSDGEPADGQGRMEGGKAVFGGGQGKGGEADNKLNIDSIIARLLEGNPGRPSSCPPPCISILIIDIIMTFVLNSILDFA